MTNPALVGLVTFDAFLGNADDQIFAGINTIGAASQFSSSNSVYGFLRGSMATQGVTAFGPQTQQIFGTNEHTFISMFGEANLNSASVFNRPFTQSLNIGSPSVINIDRDQSYTTSFVLDDTGTGGRLEVTGVGHYLLNSQDPISLYSGDLLTHFQTVTPLLPDNWLGVAQESQTWEVLDGPQAGLTGFTTSTFYTSDFLGIPEEPPVPLGAPWITTGNAVVSPPLDLTIGPFNTTAIAGTATLAGGASAIVGDISVGGAGDADSSITVTGQGTKLTAGNILLHGGASVNILDGATVDARTVDGFSGEGNNHLHVSGPSTVLNLACESNVGCGGFVAGPGIIDLSGIISSGTELLPSDTRIDNGAQLNISAQHDANAGIATLGSNHTVTVDGAGTKVHISGSNSNTTFGQITGVFINQKDSLEVTNGAQIVVDKSTVGLAGVGLGSLLGFAPDSNATPARAIVDGTGSLIDAGTLFVLGQVLTPATSNETIIDKGAGQFAELVVKNGGVVMADNILIGLNGTVNGNGGTLQGSVENRGTLAPGESPGTINIVGDFIQTSDGKLIIEIAGIGAGQFDILEVSGKFTAGGTLQIDLLDGFVPGLQDEFDFLSFGSLEGSFDNFILPTLGNGQTLRLNFGPNGISTSASVVPVPAAVWLLGSALGGLGLARRRFS